MHSRLVYHIAHNKCHISFHSQLVLGEHLKWSELDCSSWARICSICVHPCLFLGDLNFFLWKFIWLRAAFSFSTYRGPCSAWFIPFIRDSYDTFCWFDELLAIP